MKQLDAAVTWSDAVNGARVARACRKAAAEQRGMLSRCKMLRWLAWLALGLLVGCQLLAEAALNLPDGIENILGFKPKSNFQCEKDGYFGDTENDCRIFHLCQRQVHIGGRTEWRHWTYACGNQTMFNQLTLTCAFVDEAIPCRHASQFQYLNEVIHKPREPFLTDADVTSGISYYSNRVMSDGARARAFEDHRLMAQLGGQQSPADNDRAAEPAAASRFQPQPVQAPAAGAEEQPAEERAAEQPLPAAPLQAASAAAGAATLPAPTFKFSIMTDHQQPVQQPAQQQQHQQQAFLSTPVATTQPTWQTTFTPVSNSSPAPVALSVAPSSPVRAAGAPASRQTASSTAAARRQAGSERPALRARPRLPEMFQSARLVSRSAQGQQARQGAAIVMRRVNSAASPEAENANKPEALSAAAAGLERVQVGPIHFWRGRPIDAQPFASRFVDQSASWSKRRV